MFFFVSASFRNSSLVWAQEEHHSISPSHFLLKCPKRRLNQSSFVFLYFALLILSELYLVCGLCGVGSVVSWPSVVKGDWTKAALFCCILCCLLFRSCMCLCVVCILNLSPCTYLYFPEQWEHPTWMALYSLILWCAIKNLLTESRI